MNLRTAPVSEALAYLKFHLEYKPETGQFTWRVRSGNRIRPGSIAGTIDWGKHRIYVQLAGRKYFASRLAWFYMTGSWPVHEIDHADENSLNNKWANLQDITHSANVKKNWASR